MPTTSLLGTPLPEDSDALSGAAQAIRDVVAVLDSAVIRKPANQAINNVSLLQDDDDLEFEAVDGVTYQIEAHLLFGCASGGVDAKLAMTHPGGTLALSVIGMDPATTSSTTTSRVNLAGNPTFPASGTAFEIGVPSAQIAAHMFGTYVCTSDGTVRVRWSQLVATATDTLMYAGSYLAVRVIG